MSALLVRSGTAAALVLVSAQGAFAELTAQEVWDDWKSYMTGTGYTVEAAETLADGTLTVSGITMTMPVAEDNGRFRLAVPQMKFVESGDGTVRIELPADMPVSIGYSGPGDEFTASLAYGHDGSPMVVSGDASAMTYTYEVPQITLTLQDLVANGTEVPAENAKFSLALRDWASQSVVRGNGLRTYDQQVSAAEVTYNIAFLDSENAAKGTIKGSFEGLESEGTIRTPGSLETSDAAAALKSGLGVNAGITFSGSTSVMSASDGEEAFLMEGRSGSGAVAMTMSADALSYDVSQQDAEFTLTGTDVPFPLSLSMAEAGFRIMLPMSASEEEQDFSIGLTLRDFVLPEMFWGMVDPTGVLPHDPASLELDLAGRSTLLVDLYDDEAMKPVEDGEQPLGELNALTVRELRLSAAGAELTGTGDFTFDNEDLESFDGMPAPSGEANLMLTGANALLDKLIQLGVLSDDHAMGARMMLGLFAVPGEGEDSLTSRIEITEDGKILANGQRLK